MSLPDLPRLPAKLPRLPAHLPRVPRLPALTETEIARALELRLDALHPDPRLAAALQNPTVPKV